MPNDHISPQYNVRIEYKRAIINDDVVTVSNMSAPSESQTTDSIATLKLFSYSDGVNYKDSWWVGTCSRFRAKAKNGEVNYIPAIDTTGQPCMFDTVSQQPFFNNGSGSFIVGMTLTQASKLGNLPTSGGALSVSLPENYTDDEAVVEALNTATEKGWVLTIQTYSAAASAASTFAIRRIWVRKNEDPSGEYVDASGNRWRVEWCQTVLGAEPTDLGYEPFRSVDVALSEWGLTPYVYHEEETSSI